MPLAGSPQSTTAPRLGRRRLPGFLFALLVYLATARSLLYLIGFVTNVLVPKTIDNGPVATPALAVAVDLALLLAFAIPHSLLARPRPKAWLERLLPPALERSAYCLVAVVTLDLLMWQWRPLPTVLWDVQAAWGRHALAALAGAGWLLALASTLSQGHFTLFGLRQAWCWGTDRGWEPKLVLDRGLYAWFRHPLYAGFLLGIWSTPRLTVGHALLATTFSVYTLVGAALEERDLRRQMGDWAIAYQRRVPGLLPSP